MSCDLKSLSRYLDTFLLVEQFQDVALNGLQVQGSGEIKNIATAVTASLAAIERAVEMKADALIVHHGLFLKGKDVWVTGCFQKKLKKLLEHNISLFGYHIPLDAHRELGNNWAVAKALGWHSLEPFGIYQGVPIGVRGVFPSMHRAALQKQFEELYGVKAASSFALGGKEKVASCAIVSGGAHKLIYEAAQAEIDCFVTGSFDEPIWHAAFEEKINFFAFGHAATEKIGVQLLGDHLQEQFGLTHHFIDEQNPF